MLPSRYRPHSKFRFPDDLITEAIALGKGLRGQRGRRLGSIKLEKWQDRLNKPNGVRAAGTRRFPTCSLSPSLATAKEDRLAAAAAA